MRDEAITIDPGPLSLAEQAVCYLLKRIRVDVDLRWLMLHTEAFERLCIAEAQRTGEDVEKVRVLYSTMLPHCKDDEPQVVKLRRELQDALHNEEPPPLKKTPARHGDEVPAWLEEGR